MLSILLTGLLIVACSFYPVFLLANKLETGKSDFKSIIIAVIIANLTSSIIVPFIPGASIAFLSSAYAILISGLTFTKTLETDFKKAVIIALIPTLFWYIIEIIF